MTSAAHVPANYDQTDVAGIVRHSVVLGLFQAAAVLAFSVGSRFLEGVPEQILRSGVVLVGVTGTVLLPGLWTRARTIEGIAGAAGIGLGATVVFLLADVVLLQRIGTYTNRWLEIGGGSNWWYHPVWWMTGTFLAWMGAFSLANQSARGGASPAGVMGASLVLAAVVGIAATLVGFPGASFGLPTFAIAYLPAIALTAWVTGRGASRR
jgi:hypothetical protein